MRAPAQPVYGDYDSDSRGTHRPNHFGKLLLILFALTIPSLAALYVTTRLNIRILYLAALWLNLILLGTTGVVVVISGIMGAIEDRKINRLAHPNTHPKPRGR